MPAKKPAAKPKPTPKAKPKARPGASAEAKAKLPEKAKEPRTTPTTREAPAKAPGAPSEPKTGITVAKRVDGKVPKESCGNCGHWSSGAAFGLDDRSGYCNHWERITNYDYTCPDFLTKDEYQEVQQQLAEESDEDEGDFD